MLRGAQRVDCGQPPQRISKMVNMLCSRARFCQWFTPRTRPQLTFNATPNSSPSNGSKLVSRPAGDESQGSHIRVSQILDSCLNDAGVPVYLVTRTDNHRAEWVPVKMIWQCNGRMIAAFHRNDQSKLGCEYCKRKSASKQVGSTSSGNDGATMSSWLSWNPSSGVMEASHTGDRAKMLERAQVVRMHFNQPPTERRTWPILEIVGRPVEAATAGLVVEAMVAGTAGEALESKVFP